MWCVCVSGPVWWWVEEGGLWANWIDTGVPKIWLGITVGTVSGAPKASRNRHQQRDSGQWTSDKMKCTMALGHTHTHFGCLSWSKGGTHTLSTFVYRVELHNGNVSVRPHQCLISSEAVLLLNIKCIKHVQHWVEWVENVSPCCSQLSLPYITGVHWNTVVLAFDVVYCL